MSAQGYTLGGIAAAEKTFIQRVYGWMAAGLALTGAVAWMVANDPDMVRAIVLNPIAFWDC
jgi:FtsH-binding integral membrane protein